ncbi:hypothetical protein ACE1OC_00080 [Streptomyces sp. DSM 116496]|uniref:hypothetical protein n=1 Tax=Streptomyces stoeckheimensis TaxID=3344656 RepID=UPI0038B2AED0
MVKELSTEQSPLYVAETAAEFVAEKHTWDGTHPNPNGEIRIAAAFADIVASGFGIGAAYPRPYRDIAQVAEEAIGLVRARGPPPGSVEGPALRSGVRGRVS